MFVCAYIYVYMYMYILIYIHIHIYISITKMETWVCLLVSVSPGLPFVITSYHCLQSHLYIFLEKFKLLELDYIEF